MEFSDLLKVLYSLLLKYLLNIFILWKLIASIMSFNFDILVADFISKQKESDYIFIHLLFPFYDWISFKSNDYDIDKQDV